MADNTHAPRDEDEETVNEEQLGNPEPAKAHWPAPDPARNPAPKHADTYDRRKTAAGAAKQTAPQQGRDALQSKS